MFGNAADFLSEFVSEACQLIANGIAINQRHDGVQIHSFVCDAPARAFMKGIKSHSGFGACEKCCVRGEYDGKVIYSRALSFKRPLKSLSVDVHVFAGLSGTLG